MDVLSDLLNTVRLESAVFVHGELTPPWGIRTEGRDHFAFHILAQGSCWLEVDGLKPVQVREGDVVVVSRGHGQSMRDAPTSPLTPLHEFLASGAFHAPTNGNGAGTRLVCGCFQLDALPDDPLVAALPPVIHASDLANEVGWLGETVKLLGEESLADRPGGNIVVNRLCDALFVYVLRRFLSQLPEGGSSWLRALVEPHIGPALTLLHDKPAESWTVADLASRVGMSRSAFAAHFTKVVGEAPMQYLTRWRLRKAAGMLRASNAGIAEIASNVGYDSEAAFNKAFKRSIGITPGAYRRDAVRPHAR